MSAETSLWINAIGAVISAIGTVVTTIIAVWILVRELPKLKQDSAAKKVESLEYALEKLRAGEMYGQERQVINAEWKTNNPDYPEGEFQNYVVTLFSRLDYVGLLVELGYVDAKMLFYREADELYILERAITNLEKRQNSEIPNVRAKFPRAYKLLKQAAKYSQRDFKRSFWNLWSFRN